MSWSCDDRVNIARTTHVLFRNVNVNMDRSFLVVALSLSRLRARPQQLEHASANRVGGLESGEKLWRIAVDETATCMRPVASAAPSRIEV